LRTGFLLRNLERLLVHMLRPSKFLPSFSSSDIRHNFVVILILVWQWTITD
jgi:hypothetical protein